MPIEKPTTAMCIYCTKLIYVSSIVIIIIILFELSELFYYFYLITNVILVHRPLVVEWLCFAMTPSRTCIPGIMLVLGHIVILITETVE